MKLVGFFLLFTAYLCLQTTDGAKILSISFLQTKSHKIVWEPLLLKLAERGHQVTVVSPIKSDKKMPNLRNIHTIDPEELNKGMNLPNLFEVRAHTIFKLFGWLLNPFLIMGSKADLICRTSYALPSVQEVIQEKYDLVLFFSFFNECLFGAIHKMNTSTIILSGIVSPFWLADSFGSPSPPSFVPLPFLGFSDRMSFMERVQNFLNIIFHWLSMTFIYYPKVTSLYREILGDESIPSVKEIEGKANLLFSNSHISFESPRPVMPDIVDVGGLALKEAKPLSKDLEDFLSASGEDGFIYFSMGSALKGSEMPERYRQVFLQTFAKLKQQVLWKWETEHMENLPKNVKLSKWLPQQDILGHQNLRLFITHGGHGSTQESIFHGVPLVAIPMLADQTYNMETAKRLGFAVKLEFSELSEDILSDAINKVLTDSSYKQRAKELSALFHDQPETPLERAVFWTEYIIRHKGAPHLRSAARDLNFFQYQSLDVIAFLTLIFLVIGSINIVVARALIRKCCGVKKSSTSKNEEQKSKQKTGKNKRE